MPLRERASTTSAGIRARLWHSQMVGSDAHSTFELGRAVLRLPDLTARMSCGRSGQLPTKKHDVFRQLRTSYLNLGKTVKAHQGRVII
jgi:hypothetical protein